VIDRKLFFFSASAGRTVDATDFATEAVHFALTERVIAAWKRAAIIEFEGRGRRAWAEALARPDPANHAKRLHLESKVRGGRFSMIYRWLFGADALVIKADRKPHT
jgi:hypothetical protein